MWRKGLAKQAWSDSNDPPSYRPYLEWEVCENTLGHKKNKRGHGRLPFDSLAMWYCYCRHKWLESPVSLPLVSKNSGILVEIQVLKDAQPLWRRLYFTSCPSLICPVFACGLTGPDEQPTGRSAKERGWSRFLESSRHVMIFVTNRSFRPWLNWYRRRLKYSWADVARQLPAPKNRLNRITFLLSLAERMCRSPYSRPYVGVGAPIEYRYTKNSTHFLSHPATYRRRKLEQNWFSSRDPSRQALVLVYPGEPI